MINQQEKEIFLKVNLHFFDEGDKTEQATPKKRKKAREEGQVAKSQEVSTAFLLVAVFFSLKFFVPMMIERMLAVYQYLLVMVGDVDQIFDMNFMVNLVWYMFYQSIIIGMPIMIVAILIGVESNVMQVGWHITTKPLMPKLSKLNPIQGFKRMFSLRGFLELGKSLAKFLVILFVMYSVIKKEINNLPAIFGMELVEASIYIGNIIVKMGIDVGLMFLFIALADYIFARLKHDKDLKMSKHEVKEEYKQAEGNPQIKGKIRQKMREISMRRMMQDIPKADVIITNPTHYAVAVQYDKLRGEAPIVVAKGVDFLAKRIKEVAKESQIEIVENVQLARALYATVDVGREIPPELYQAVAEVLAFVYRLKNKV